MAEGHVLWEPSADRIAGSRLTAFLTWLAQERGLVFTGYTDLWQWSVDHLDEFWLAIWSYFSVGEGAADRVLEWGNGAEGASWFPTSELNYVDRVLAHPAHDLALVSVGEDRETTRLTYGELLAHVGAAAAGLRRLGVGRGDRVAAVVGNGAEAVIAFLATAALGAVWSSCAPEFGAPSMVDRFRQIDPKVLLCADTYRYGGRTYDLGAKRADLELALAGLEATVVVTTDPGAGTPAVDVDASPRRITWAELLAEAAVVAPTPVPFAHPLWILYSSGTTGLPKPIVHGHGGIVLEHLKSLALHCDLGPGERFFWFTTTGWMMWNFLVGGLLVGATIVCFDGDPMWPDQNRLWRLADDESITFFGTSAPFLEACRRASALPKEAFDLDIRSVGSTGAPLSPEGFAWTATQAGDDVLVGSISGGTDVCTAFLTSCPLLPVRAGELQCRALGVDAAAFDVSGHPVVDEVGELVITTPMPSMPVAMWGDVDGSRLHGSYFAKFPGVWWHGDWVKITPEGSAVVYGRSDATLNRGGVRMGTSEFYRVVESLPDVADALVVDTSELGHQGELVLLVVPEPSAAGVGGGSLSHDAENRIRLALREQLSPRHVPDRVLAVGSLPRTMNGKKIEVPIRRILLGVPPDDAVSRDALTDPEALQGVLSTLAGAGLL